MPGPVEANAVSADDAFEQELRAFLDPIDEELGHRTPGADLIESRKLQNSLLALHTAAEAVSAETAEIVGRFLILSTERSLFRMAEIHSFAHDVRESARSVLAMA